MSNFSLTLVREEASFSVWTEHSDRIHPKDLSRHLSDAVGKERFRISLRKNIYIIYVYRRHCRNDDNRDPGSDDEEGSMEYRIGPKTYQERLQDINLAEKKLSSERITKW
ncbi:hypothetical protein COCC4DRAFT_150447 [Bipolaris maydis ATCC 48331]|uniref:Uncharacterized protein n=2 Tax=Cochliobolus heterostrophus TaxID=5016 RepID=M2TCQ4_COCH5|nr:uncharacterized protein COCC4DRAFT_150447 [Bipolaris maydis ATCC 48331]EMD84787.1 hypothetical protein COCHEDRAFT_1024812 [Bipolaris maydis C5]EMD95320.1 hypothetical protein COCHEDRAFT_1020033 [Bipolaris maydis C5]ENI00467.1 hypothetical protein COCC4DRAFT_150447 [Bipolaris maydis ATCC 48331]